MKMKTGFTIAVRTRLNPWNTNKNSLEPSPINFAAKATFPRGGVVGAGVEGKKVGRCVVNEFRRVTQLSVRTVPPENSVRPVSRLGRIKSVLGKLEYLSLYVEVGEALPVGWKIGFSEKYKYRNISVTC